MIACLNYMGANWKFWKTWKIVILNHFFIYSKHDIMFQEKQTNFRFMPKYLHPRKYSWQTCIVNFVYSCFFPFKKAI